MTQSADALLKKSDEPSLEQLREAVNESAGAARSLYFTFLLFGTYLGVTIASTTDEQLLRVSPVTLPILEIELPIVAFYAVVPWLLVLVHTYLLLQLYLLARRVHLFNDALADMACEAARERERALLAPFPFVHMLARSRSPLLRATYAATVWITIVWLPVLLVLSAQVRFLPYHDSAVTNATRAALACQLLVLCVSWSLILNGDDALSAGWWWTRVRRPVARLRDMTWPWAKRTDTPSPAPARARGLSAVLGCILPVLGFSWGVAVLPDEPMERWVATVLPASESAVPQGAGNRLTEWVFDGPGAPLHRNLSLSEKVLVASVLDPEELRSLRDPAYARHDEVLDRVTGLDLSGRDLRRARLSLAVLPKADLRGANLDGADLRNANLRNVDMRPLEVPTDASCVSGAGPREAPDSQGLWQLCPASARNAALRGAQMTDWRAPYARLQGADLREGNLADADLANSDLRGARLIRTILSGADLRNVDLSEARMSGRERPDLPLQTDKPELSGSRLLRINLDGIQIESAAFAAISDSSLRGSKLSGADLRGVAFSSSDLRGARLDGADLRGASFTDTDLRGATFHDARLELARMQRTQACMTDFRGADLIGADLSDVRLDGSSLSGADLRFARIRDVTARAANLTGAVLDPFAMFRLQLDYADARHLRATQPDGVEELQELASTLRSQDVRLSNEQDQTLQALSSGQLTMPEPNEFQALADRALLCDETTRRLRGATLDAHCMDERQRLRFRRELLAVGCEDPNLMNGLLHQSGVPARARDRGGRVPPGPVRDDANALLREIAGCPETEALLDAGAKDTLRRIRVAMRRPHAPSEPTTAPSSAPCEIP